MPVYTTPGVYKEEIFAAPETELRIGVPAFLGFASRGPYNTPIMLSLWTQFGENFGDPDPNGFLSHAVRGFFENEGSLCFVVRLEGAGTGELALENLRKGLDALKPLDSYDLVCVPDIMYTRDYGDQPPDPDSVRIHVQALQMSVLEHCKMMGDCFALLDALPGGTDTPTLLWWTSERFKNLDSLPGASVDDVLAQRQGLNGKNGCLNYPWICVEDGPARTNGFVPPCGHIAGIYARSDRLTGVHKAPANEVIRGILDVEVKVTDNQQGRLNSGGVNCIRAFPGRGMRLWGARTLSEDPAWTYVNVRRLFLTTGRWIERNMAEVVFEPNSPALWVRITRQLNAYLLGLFQKGAMRGRTAAEAFYVKCDAETNPPEVRDSGNIITEIGLAPSVPSEFVIVRLVHGTSGVAITELT